MALSIQSEIKNLSPVERELSIVIPGTEVAKELDKAYRELSQKVKLKGFRQGKVPRYVLEQYYKADTEQRVVERIVTQSFKEAVKTHSIEPVDNPKISGAGELIPGMDFRFQAKVEVKPAISIQQWKGLEIKRTKHSASDGEVDKLLDQMREQQAKVTPVEDRDTVQQGDLVETNWSGTVEGEHVKGLSGISYVIEIGGGTFPYKEAEQALVGKKVGETFHVDVKLPADFRVESAREKTADLTIKILGIKHKSLPALDDEFAKDVDEAVETLAALKDKLREDLGKSAEARTTAETRDAAVAALIEKNPFDVPQSLIDRQSEQIAIDRLSRLPQQQAEMIWQAQHVRLKEDARPIAMRQVRVSLILEELVKAEKIEISDADVDAHIEKVAKDVGSDVKTVRKVYAKGGRLGELKFQLATNRMLDRVIEEAKVSDA
jgi:trigger factor